MYFYSWHKIPLKIWSFSSHLHFEIHQGCFIICFSSIARIQATAILYPLSSRYLLDATLTTTLVFITKFFLID